MGRRWLTAFGYGQRKEREFFRIISMEKYIDLSRTIEHLMPVYPGDVPTHLQQISDFVRDGHTGFHLSTGLHAGTHIDGPMHLTARKQYMSEILPERLVGAGCLLNAVGESVIQCKPEFESLVIPDGIVAIYTGYDRKFLEDGYFHEYPIVSRDLASLFIRKRIKMLCLDTPSPDKPPYEIHKLLLENNVLIAENLCTLNQLFPVQAFEIIALPLRMHADSSPARIIARIVE
jgi:kynurenine formamidase